MGTASQDTQLQTVDQNMADAQTDHDMSDVAVVEHPHPHEDEEHVEWEHPEKVYFDEDDGTALDPVQVRPGVERGMAFMGELGVGEPCNRPKTGKVWSTRWCYRRKGDAVRSRLVVRQFREGTDPSVHVGTPGPAAARILLFLSAIYSLFAADFSVAFMHTPMTEEVFVELPEEANMPKDKAWRSRRALDGLRCAAAAFQAYLGSPLEDVGFRRRMAAPSIYNREDDGVKMSVHVDDPLVIGPDQSEFCLSGWDNALLTRVWRLLTLCVDSSTWGWCTTLFQVDSFRLCRGDGLDDGRDARQNAYDIRNPTKATDGGRRETCG